MFTNKGLQQVYENIIDYRKSTIISYTEKVKSNPDNDNEFLISNASKVTIAEPYNKSIPAENTKITINTDDRQVNILHYDDNGKMIFYVPICISTSNYVMVVEDTNGDIVIDIAKFGDDIMELSDANEISEYPIIELSVKPYNEKYRGQIVLEKFGPFDNPANALILYTIIDSDMTNVILNTNNVYYTFMKNKNKLIQLVLEEHPILVLDENTYVLKDMSNNGLELVDFEKSSSELMPFLTYINSDMSVLELENNKIYILPNYEHVLKFIKDKINYEIYQQEILDFINLENLYNTLLMNKLYIESGMEDAEKVISDIVNTIDIYLEESEIIKELNDYDNIYLYDGYKLNVYNSEWLQDIISLNKILKDII